jgi:hypothetical protein
MAPDLEVIGPRILAMGHNVCMSGIGATLPLAVTEFNRSICSKIQRELPLVIVAAAL